MRRLGLAEWIAVIAVILWCIFVALYLIDHRPANESAAVSILAWFMIAGPPLVWLMFMLDNYQNDPPRGPRGRR